MAHGILMIAAWMWLVPFGILAAVYRHKLGPGWIKVHTVIQTSVRVSSFPLLWTLLRALLPSRFCAFACFLSLFMKCTSIIDVRSCDSLTF
jgi:hypothetical protein